jgi:hypothetical protein
MDRYERPQTDPTIALHRGLYMTIIIGRYGGPHSAFNGALQIGLYLAIIMDRYERPKVPLI